MARKSIPAPHAPVPPPAPPAPAAPAAPPAASPGAGGASPKPSGSRSRAQLRRPRILVVDDVADNREMYMEYLKVAGFSVIGAVDGATAIEVARTHHPAVIVMDISMPGVDGCQATQVLKADPETREILIFAVTGHAEASYRERATAAGCDLFIPKPCSPQDLAEHIRRHLDLAISEDAATSKR